MPGAARLLAAGSAASAAAAEPHIVSILVDDLGFYDTQIHNPDSFMTPAFGALARDGITLQRHYTYSVCSPSRRSFLSGRFPVHITAEQAPTCSNYLPLQFTLLPGKLKQAGYETHMIGKGHLGYQTTDHLPVNRGFDSHIGYLGGEEDYHWGNALHQGPAQCSVGEGKCKKDMWHDHLPGVDLVDEIYYSTNFYTDRAVALIRGRNASRPFYLHLTYQSVHEPLEEPPRWEQIPNGSVWWDHTWGSMLNVVDKGVANLTAELRAQGMYETTLVVLAADNGGDCHGPANNFPLRGRKCTAWDGGVRTAAVVSGGRVPAARRGGSSDVLIHVADWYATLCALAGVPPADPAAVGGGVHDIDGVDVWPALTGANATHPRAAAGEPGRPAWVPVTNWSIVAQYTNGTIMKLLTKAGHSTLFMANGSQAKDKAVCDTCTECSAANPCLFDLTADPSERSNLAASRPGAVAAMAAKLASYVAYVDGEMGPGDLAQYNCTKQVKKEWGNYAGPCCRPLAPGPGPAPPGPAPPGPAPPGPAPPGPAPAPPAGGHALVTAGGACLTLLGTQKHAGVAVGACDAGSRWQEDGKGRLTNLADGMCLKLDQKDGGDACAAGRAVWMGKCSGSTEGDPDFTFDAATGHLTVDACPAMCAAAAGAAGGGAAVGAEGVALGACGAAAALAFTEQ